MLARKNLFVDLPRFFVALCGIVFAVALVTIQYGIFSGFVNSSGLLIDRSHADLWVASQDMLYLENTLPLQFGDVAKVRAVHGVARAEAIVFHVSQWLGPGGKLELIRVVGFDPAGKIFDPGDLSLGAVEMLSRPHAVIVDRANLWALGVAGVGGHGRIERRDAEVVDTVSGSQPIVSPTFVFTSLDNAKAFLSSAYPKSPLLLLESGGIDDDDPISYILVDVTPGADVAAVQAGIERAVPGTRAFTTQRMAQITRTYWQDRTRIGFLLAIGALLGVVVGVAVVGQILHASISEHLKEYGTLKAMGAPDSVFVGIVMQQAVMMAFLGFIPGMLASLGISWWANLSHGTPILITPLGAGLVLVVSILMCVVAGMFAMGAVLRLDPAVVFRA